MSLVGPPAGSHYRQQKERVVNAAPVFEEGRHLRSYLRNTSNVSKNGCNSGIVSAIIHFLAEKLQKKPIHL